MIIVVYIYIGIILMRISSASGQLVIGIMSLSSMSVMTSILVIYLHHNEMAKPLPKKVQNVLFNCVARVVCMRSKVPDPTSVKVAPDEEETTAKLAEFSVDEKDESSNQDIRGIANDLSFIASKMRKQSRDEEIIEQWRALAKLLDRIFFWIGVIYILVSLIIFLSNKDTNY